MVATRISGIAPVNRKCSARICAQCLRFCSASMGARASKCALRRAAMTPVHDASRARCAREIAHGAQCDSPWREPRRFARASGGFEVYKLRSSCGAAPAHCTAERHLAWAAVVRPRCVIIPSAHVPQVCCNRHGRTQAQPLTAASRCLRVHPHRRPCTSTLPCNLIRQRKTTPVSYRATTPLQLRSVSRASTRSYSHTLLTRCARARTASSSRGRRRRAWQPVHRRPPSGRRHPSISVHCTYASHQLRSSSI